MAILTVTLSGSGIVANSSKSYTISDTDLQSILSWASATYTDGTLNNQQVLLAWLQNQLVQPTIFQVRNFMRPAAPAPINIS